MIGWLAEWVRKMSRMIETINGNIIMHLGDNVAATRLSVRNSDGKEIASIASNGRVIGPKWWIDENGYLNTDGNITGLTLNSTVGTGFAPITVLSATKVYALNADQVDGADAQTTPAAGKIPIADGAGKLDGWVTSNPSGANPTATAGKTAISGSAATFMRSDGAPAIGDSDKVDGAHASATPAASTIPVADAGGKLAPAWMPAIGCRVTKGAAQAIPNNTWTAIQFDAEYFDTDTMHDNVTNNTRITIKTAGYYAIGGCVEWASNIVGARLLQIRKGGTTILASAVYNSDQNGNAPGTVQTAVYLAVNDYLELLVYQASGANLNTATMYDYSPVLYAMRIG